MVCGKQVYLCVKFVDKYVLLQIMISFLKNSSNCLPHISICGFSKYVAQSSVCIIKVKFYSGWVYSKKVKVTM